MEDLNHFKELQEREKSVDYANLEKLTITKDGKTTVHTSNDSTTVEDVDSEKKADEDTYTKSVEVKKDDKKSKSKEESDDEDNEETKKED